MQSENNINKIALKRLFPEVEEEVLSLYLEQSGNSLDKTISLLIENGVPMNSAVENEGASNNTRNIIDLRNESQNENKCDESSYSSESDSNSLEFEAMDSNLFGKRRQQQSEGKKRKKKSRKYRQRSFRTNDNNKQETKEVDPEVLSNRLIQNGAIFINEKDRAEVIVHRDGHCIFSVELPNRSVKHRYLSEWRRKYNSLNFPKKFMTDLKSYIYGPFVADLSEYSSFESNPTLLSWIQSKYNRTFGVDTVVPVFLSENDNKQLRQIYQIRQSDPKCASGFKKNLSKLNQQHYYYLLNINSVKIGYNRRGEASRISLKHCPNLSKHIWNYSLFPFPLTETQTETQVPIIDEMKIVEDNKPKDSFVNDEHIPFPLNCELMQQSCLNLKKMRWVVDVYQAVVAYRGHASNRLLENIYNSVNFFTKTKNYEMNQQDLTTMEIKCRQISQNDRYMYQTYADYLPFTTNCFISLHQVYQIMDILKTTQTECPSIYPIMQHLPKDAELLANSCQLRDIEFSPEQIETVRFLIQQDQTKFSGLLATTINLYNATGERFIFDYSRNMLHLPTDITFDKRTGFNIGQMGSGKTITTGAMIQFDINKQNMWELKAEENMAKIDPTLKEYLKQCEIKSRPKYSAKRTKASKTSQTGTNKSNKSSSKSASTTMMEIVENEIKNDPQNQVAESKVENIPNALLTVEVPTTLILCSPSLISNWEDEIVQHFDERIKFLNAYGRSQNPVTLKELFSTHIIITSYDSFRNGRQFAVPVDRIKFRRIVCDEAHELKVGNTVLNKKLSTTHCDRWYFLTGTPVVSVLKDLAPLIKLSDANVVQRRKQPQKKRDTDESEITEIVSELKQEEEKFIDEHQYASNDPAYFSFLSNLSVRASAEDVLKLQNYARHPPEHLYISFTAEEKLIYEDQLKQAQLLTRTIAVDDGIARRHIFNNLRRACSYSVFTPEEQQKVKEEITRLQQLRTTNADHNATARSTNRFGGEIDLNATGTAEQESFQSKNESCIVCLETFDDQSVQLRNCRHTFHKICLEGCLHALQMRCPLCRDSILISDVQRAKFRIETEVDANAIQDDDVKMNVSDSMQLDSMDNTENGEQLANKVEVTSKINFLTNLLKTSYDQVKSLGQKLDKCLVFSCFPETLNKLKRDFESHAINVISLNCPASQRGKLIQKFKTDDKYTVLLLSPYISAGLNLTCANTNYFFEPLDNIHLFKQAAGRIDRISQKKSIKTVHLIMQDSVESKLHDLNCRRLASLSNANQTGNAANFSDSNQLTSFDINNLLM